MSDRPVRVVDTNVILRHLIGDHADHSPRASALMLRVRRGEETVLCPATAVFEAIYVLEGRAKAPRPVIAALLSELFSPEDFLVENKGSVLAAIQFWAEQPPLDYADCYHLALARGLGMDAIYSFDKKMNRFPGVERLEP